MSGVWCKGDDCLAPWSEDGELYECKVEKIIHSPFGKVSAQVKYKDYEGHTEEVDISKLQKSPVIVVGVNSKSKNNQTGITAGPIKCTSIFKPLNGNEEETRIRDKFAQLEKEEDLFMIDKPIPSSSRPSRKLAPIQFVNDSQNPPQGQAKKKKCLSSKAQTNTLTDSPKMPGETISVDNRIETGSGNGGFDDFDLEKPRFEFPAVGCKVPYKLSQEDGAYEIPSSINQYLRDYQRDGVQFLYDSYCQNTGAILGDDMGLGKTVQVIAFLAAMLKKRGNREDVIRLKPKFIRDLSDTRRVDDVNIHRPYLIIGPGSVLYNWLDELETWGYFQARKFHGSDKKETLNDLKKGKIEIVVTTYETFRDNVSDLNSVKWCAIIVDEVHRIKGLNSQTTSALRKIKTLCRFGLTGTALQNNLIELWAILDWARPGCLGELKKFESEFVKKIERGQKHDATKRELAEARKAKEKFGVLRNKMMLRRTKQLIADQLPDKDDNIVFCKLTDLQMDVYKAILNHTDLKQVLTMDEPCDCGSRRVRVKCCHSKTAEGTPVRHLIFTFMSLLMKTANHVALLMTDKKSSETLKKLSEEICKIAFQNHPQFINKASNTGFRTLSDPKYCGKMKILHGLLSTFQKNHSKVLLFSYSTKLLDIVEQYVISVGYEFRRMDGSVSNKKRMDIVREFNKDKNIFICLISTRAGGLGLNLTGANVVIVFDPNWNPSYDLQAQDRAYRTGQRRNVRVFRLVSAGTIEENIYLRQVYKQQLDTVAIGMDNAKRYFHGIQGDKNHKGELFGIKNMFSLRTGDNCLTLDILKRNENLEAGLRKFDIAEYSPPSVESSEREETSESIESKSGESSDLDDFMDFFFDTKNKDKPATGSADRDSTAHVKETTEEYTASSGDDNQSVSSLTDVLENSGVLHVHANRCVIGGSKVEDHISRCAVQDVFELHLNSQLPAIQCEPLSQSEHDVDSNSEKKQKKGQKKPRKDKTCDFNQSCVRTVNDTRILIGQTPKAIRSEQFDLLVTFCGLKSRLELAERILNLVPKERVDLLNRFYTSQMSELPPLFVFEESPPHKKIASTKNTPQSVSQKRSSTKKSSTVPPKKLFHREGRKGVDFDSSQDSMANIVNQSNITKPSTSGHRVKESSHFKPSDLESSSGDEMDLGIKPKRSPAPRKSLRTKTRTRFVKRSTATTPIPASISVGLENTYVESMNNEHDFEIACQSIPVNELLNDLEVSRLSPNKTQQNDLRTGQALKNTSSHDQFGLLDEIFLGEKQVAYRKPAPVKKDKASESSRTNEMDKVEETSSNTNPVPMENESLSIITSNSTLKHESILDLFADSSKWKKRERKRPVKTKPDSLSEKVDKLINTGREEYESMFLTGKMRKLSKDNGKESCGITKGTSSPNSQSYSLFSGK